MYWSTVYLNLFDYLYSFRKIMIWSKVFSITRSCSKYFLKIIGYIIESTCAIVHKCYRKIATYLWRNYMTLSCSLLKIQLFIKCWNGYAKRGSLEALRSAWEFSVCFTFIWCIFIESVLSSLCLSIVLHSGAELLGFRYWFWHRLAVWPWGVYLISLCLHFVSLQNVME